MVQLVMDLLESIITVIKQSKLFKHTAIFSPDFTSKITVDLSVVPTILSFSLLNTAKKVNHFK